MTTDILTEALSELKTLLLLMIAVVLVWFLGREQALQSSRQISNARDLATWFALHEVGRKLDPRSPERLGVSLGMFNESAKPGDRIALTREQLEANKLWLQPMWFGEQRASYVLTLRHDYHWGVVSGSVPMPGAGGVLRVYDIAASDASLPYNDYQLLLEPYEYGNSGEIHSAHRLVVVPRQEDRVWQDVISERKGQWPGYSPTIRIASRSWDSSVRDLQLHGYPYQDSATELSIEKVAEYLKDVRDTRFEVLGFYLEPALFHRSVGLFLLCFAVAMLGPLAVIARRDGLAVCSPWLFASPLGRFARTQNAALLVVSLILASMPLGIGLLVLSDEFPLEETNTPLEYVAVAGCIVTAVVLAHMSLLLNQLRRDVARGQGRKAVS